MVWVTWSHFGILCRMIGGTQLSLKLTQSLDSRMENFVQKKWFGVELRYLYCVRTEIHYPVTFDEDLTEVVLRRTAILPRPVVDEVRSYEKRSLYSEVTSRV